MLTEPVTLRLELGSHPKNVTLVRSAITGLSEALGLDLELTSDLKTALSEACNNVALHAYDGEAGGPMVVELQATQAGVAAAVLDRGSGMLRISGAKDRMGLGLALISTLASSSEFRHPPAGGTEVRMWFACVDAGARSLPDELLATSIPVEPPQTDRSADYVLVTFLPPGVLRFVLGRIVRALAAMANFSVARITYLAEANDAISRYVAAAADGPVQLSIAQSPRRLALRAGPLVGHDAAGAEAALGGVVEELHAEPDAVSFVLVDPSR